MNPGDLNLATLDEILLAHTGEEVNLDSEMVLVYEADKDKSIEKQLSKMAQ
jgi:phage-related protein